MKVIASATGFWNGRRVRQGEVFLVPDDTIPAKWFAPEGGWSKPKARAKSGKGGPALTGSLSAVEQATVADGDVPRDTFSKVEDVTHPDGILPDAEVDESVQDGKDGMGQDGPKPDTAKAEAKAEADRKAFEAAKAKAQAKVEKDDGKGLV